MISKPQIKYITSLQQKKYRTIHKSFVVEGRKIVMEALKQVSSRIEYICYTSKNKDIIDFSGAVNNEKLLEASEKEFVKISSLANPQGILAVLKQPDTDQSPKELTSDITLVLDSVRDPGNLGTIIRLCDWFGVQQIVCSHDTVDCYNPKVVQATMGAILRVEIYYTELAEWLTTIEKKKEIKLYGTAMDGKNIYTTKLEKPAVLIMGNEANGISENIIRLVDTKLCIPNYSEYPDKTESLNVSIATAIMCAEFRRNNS
jgi:RNA methyltransferase, TrmH family